MRIRNLLHLSPSAKNGSPNRLPTRFEAESSVSQTLYGAMLFLHLCELPVVEYLARRRPDRDWLKDLLADIEARKVHDVKNPTKLAAPRKR